MNNTLYIDVSLDILTQVVDVDIAAESSTQCLDVEISGDSSQLPFYEGDYCVTPSVNEVVLPTKNKSMVDDVTVFQIPYSSVSNPAGGETITIGLE